MERSRIRKRFFIDKLQRSRMGMIIHNSGLTGCFFADILPAALHLILKG
jgi:hypothetical protein